LVGELEVQLHFRCVLVLTDDVGGELEAVEPDQPVSSGEVAIGMDHIEDRVQVELSPKPVNVEGLIGVGLFYETLGLLQVVGCCAVALGYLQRCC